MLIPSAAAIAIAANCEDAYSSDNYESWPSLAQELLDMGYDARESEAIMRSKYARWAGDMSAAEYGSIPSTAMADLKVNCPALFAPAAIARIVIDTF